MLFRSVSAPQLRADLAIVEQRFRDEQSFVVKDPTTHAYFRFRPVEMRVMRLFDGARSAAQIAEQLVADGVRVSSSTVEGFARKLAALGLLERTLLERTTQQLERLRAERRRHSQPELHGRDDRDAHSPAAHRASEERAGRRVVEFAAGDPAPRRR